MFGVGGKPKKQRFSVPAVLLYLLGRSPLPTAGAGLMDLGMAVLFWAAYVKTRW